MQNQKFSAKLKPSSNLIFFLDELEDFISSEHIFSDFKNKQKNNRESTAPKTTKSLKHFHQNTEKFYKNINAAIMVSSISQILKIINLATKYQIQLYPISCGNNWGYGTKLPVSENSVILDLSLMNTILEVNEELGYAVVEPGVTQGQFAEYLKNHNSKFHYDATGAGPNASIMGNALERGFGLGLHADHYEAIAGMEVILTNGEIVRTGFWNFTSEPIAHCYKWGLGPLITGIFTQSNFGIVSKICIWLSPIPESISLVCIKIGSTELMGKQIASLRDLFDGKLLNSGFNIASSTRLMTTYTKYPWNEANDQVPMEPQLKAKLEKRFKLSPWTIFIPVRGTQAQVKIQKLEIKKRLIKTNSMYCISKNTISICEKIPRFIQQSIPLIKQTLSMKPFFEFLLGQPKEFTLATPYWRNKNQSIPNISRDPARDGCGLLWFAPTLPFTEDSIKKFLKLTTPILEKHGFDDLFSLLYCNSRTIICTLPIVFNANNEQEVAASHSCYQELSKRCMDSGFIIYRSNIMNMPDYKNQAYTNLLKSIKSALDPKGILARGRYLS